MDMAAGVGVSGWRIRTVTPEQASYLRGQRYNREKGAHGGQIPGSSSEKQDSPKNNRTAHRLGKEYGFCHDTISKDGQLRLRRGHASEGSGRGWRVDRPARELRFFVYHGRHASRLVALRARAGAAVDGVCRSDVTASCMMAQMIRLTLQRDHLGHVVLIHQRGKQWRVLDRSAYPCNQHPALWRRWCREAARLSMLGVDRN